MALPRFRTPVQDGNWSDPNTWNDGIIPEENDVVCLNTKNIIIDTDVNVYQIRDDAQNYLNYNSFSYLTSNTEPEGIADGSDTDQFYNNWLPFSNTNTYDNYPYPSYANPRWWTYEYPNQEPIVISEYRFNGYSSNHQFNPRDWKFQGWDDVNEVWVDIDSQTNVTSPYNGGATFIGDVSSNTTAYYKYRFIFYATRDGEDRAIAFMYVKLIEKGTSKITTAPGGTLTINNSSTWNTAIANQLDINVGTYLFSTASYNLITSNIEANDTVNFNLNSYPAKVSNYSTIRIDGDSGTYNYNGDFIYFIGNTYQYYIGNTIYLNAPCTLNITGKVTGGNYTDYRAAGLYVPVNGATINVVGDVEGAEGLNVSSAAIYITGASDLNITGNVLGNTNAGDRYGGMGLYVSNAQANINIVGNVLGSNQTGSQNHGSENRSGMYIYNANSLNVTGNIIGGTDGYPSQVSKRFVGAYVANVNTFISIGFIQSSSTSYGLTSNLNTTYMVDNPVDYRLSGPFISGDTGLTPYVLPYFKLIFNAGMYYEFRDVDLNTTQLVSPASVIDSPSPEDVRLGTRYANDNYTGTLAVPNPNRVSLGVPTDNTVGTAVLTADDVWNAQTSAMNTDGSIGKRLKNASTVDSTGDQLSSLI